jgi:putative membrane protein
VDRLIALAINAAALWVADRLVDGISFIGEWWQFLVVAVAFGLVNTFLRPILRILTLPITILTLGLFLLVINALMLLLTSAVAQGLNISFLVDGFWSALLGAIVVSIVGLILSLVVGGGRAALRLA